MDVIELAVWGKSSQLERKVCVDGRVWAGGGVQGGRLEGGRAEIMFQSSPPPLMSLINFTGFC